jgi:hypothetical protein
LDPDAFEALFTQVDVASVLQQARGAKPPVQTTHAPAQRPDYSSIEHAGTPHGGRVTAAEKRTVWTHLAEVNKNLEARGYRPIDPDNREHLRRYGHPEPMKEVDDRVW